MFWGLTNERNGKKRTDRGPPSRGDDNESGNDTHAETTSNHIGDVPQRTVHASFEGTTFGVDTDWSGGRIGRKPGKRLW